MHNRLFGWVNGRARKSVGVYWGSLGICLAHQSPGKKPIAVYVPIGKDAENSAWDEAAIRLETLCGVARSQVALSVALNADDMFVRAITVPEGLDDRQLEQVAIVEAVANLPVPPEEICLDFIRAGIEGRDEIVKIAFCRRERIDEILACAEEIAIPVHVVDRDVQAIHDVIDQSLSTKDERIEYPFGIVLPEVAPRIAICLGPTDFEVYPIRLPSNENEDLSAGLISQLGNCWTRCRMSRSVMATCLEQVFVVGNKLAPYGFLSIGQEGDVSKRIVPLVISSDVEMAAPNSFLPEEVVLIALGMSGRSLA